MLEDLLCVRNRAGAPMGSAHPPKSVGADMQPVAWAYFVWAYEHRAPYETIEQTWVRARAMQDAVLSSGSQAVAFDVGRDRPRAQPQGK